MKNLLLILLAVLFTSPWASAQFTVKGNFMIGSTFGLSTANSKIIQNAGNGDTEGKGPSSTQFSISPKVGYFPIDNLAVGIGMDYTSSRVEQPNLDVINDSDLLFGPFARYHFLFGGEDQDMAFIMEANFGFGNSSDNLEIGGTPQNINTNIFAAGIGPGFSIFSSKGMSMAVILKYNYARSKFDTNVGGVSQSTITRTNQFNLSVGFQYFFTAIAPVQKPEGATPRLY